VKNSSRDSFEKTTEDLRRNQVFQNRKNPLVMYNDVELYDFILSIFLTIVDELWNTLTRLLTGCSASHGDIAL